MRFIKKALCLAKHYTSKDIQKARERLSDVERIINRGTRSLTIFTEDKDQIEELVKQIKHERDVLKGIIKFGPDYQSLNADNFVPLRWRNKEGWPALAICPIPRGKFFIHAGFDFPYTTGEWQISTRPSRLPPWWAGEEFAENYYEDVIDRLSSRCKGKTVSKRNACIEFQISGLLPLEVEEKIKKVRDGFNEFWNEVYLLVEVDEWKVNKTVLSKPGSSFLALFCEGRQFWIIAKSRLLSLEEFGKL